MDSRTDESCRPLPHQPAQLCWAGATESSGCLHRIQDCHREVSRQEASQPASQLAQYRPVDSATADVGIHSAHGAIAIALTRNTLTLVTGALGLRPETISCNQDRLSFKQHAYQTRPIAAGEHIVVRVYRCYLGRTPAITLHSDRMLHASTYHTE
jgi:hypothetical protein